MRLRRFALASVSHRALALAMAKEGDLDARSAFIAGHLLGLYR